jgi:hypothetical protein
LLTAEPPHTLIAKRNGRAEARIRLRLRQGYHVNSNTPNQDFLIPLRLSWETGPLAPLEVIFPKPEQHDYAFSSKPVSVFTGDFQVVTRFQVAADAPAGPGILVGKLRYQACSQDTCYRPATLEIRLPYEVR